VNQRGLLVQRAARLRAAQHGGTLLKHARRSPQPTTNKTPHPPSVLLVCLNVNGDAGQARQTLHRCNAPTLGPCGRAKKARLSLCPLQSHWCALSTAAFTLALAYKTNPRPRLSHCGHRSNPSSVQPCRPRASGAARRRRNCAGVEPFSLSERCAGRCSGVTVRPSVPDSAARAGTGCGILVDRRAITATCRARRCRRILWSVMGART
jgi:hypothetical protein